MATRKTRSGREYSSVVLPPDFALDSLLQRAMEGAPDPDESDYEGGGAVCDEEDDAVCAASSPPDPTLSDAEDSPAYDTPADVSRKGKRKRRSRQQRQAKRAKQVEDEGHRPRDDVTARYLASSATIATDLQSESLPASRDAYVAKNTPEASAQRRCTPQQLDELGFRRVQWDGKKVLLIRDASGRIVAICVGGARCADWPSVHRRVHEAILREGRNADAAFTPAQRMHRRGKFPAVNVGVSPAMGSSMPVNLDQGKRAPMVERLLANKDLQRMAGFASAALHTYAPKVAAHYKERLDRLYAKHPHLRKPFARSTYPVCAINFGPQVRTFKHRDILNCPFGLCAIQAMGTFDCTKGGHIVLWDLKLYIDFPPGSLILIPSATLVHSNTPVMPHETRTSFTQYCGGGLLRYVDNGFKPVNKLQRRRGDVADDGERWREALNMFTTLDELGLPMEPAECT